jgi:hypothetical protein
MRAEGRAGLVATTSVVAGDSLVRFSEIFADLTIYRGIRQMPWPGSDAQQEICVVWFANQPSSAAVRVLDGERVDEISPDLRRSALRQAQQPSELRAELVAFEGTHYAKAQSFMLKHDSAWKLTLQQNGSPYLRRFINADDVAQGWTDASVKWIVDTLDEPLESVRSRSLPTWEFLVTVVQPARTAEVLRPYKGLIDRWWQMWNPRASDYRSLREREYGLVLPFVAKFVFAVRVPTSWVFANKLCVVKETRPDLVALLNSEHFDTWIRRYSGRRGAGVDIALSRGVRSFPLPRRSVVEAAAVEWERAVATATDQLRRGQTNLLNRVHEHPEDRDPAIERLRELRVELDRAVADAYGWSDLELDHDFRETPHGLRLTFSDPVRTEVLDRLLELNHKRYAEEVARGLHDAKRKKTR